MGEDSPWSRSPESHGIAAGALIHSIHEHNGQACNRSYGAYQDLRRKYQIESFYMAGRQRETAELCINGGRLMVVAVICSVLVTLEVKSINCKKRASQSRTRPERSKHHTGTALHAATLLVLLQHEPENIVGVGGGPSAANHTLDVL
jgi:hypothetical protein